MMQLSWCGISYNGFKKVSKRQKVASKSLISDAQGVSTFSIVLRGVFELRDQFAPQGAVVQSSQSDQEHQGKPLLFMISALGSLTCIAQHNGPIVITFHPKDAALHVMVKVSILRTLESVMTGTRTHT